MVAPDENGTVVDVSRTGRITIPEELRERLDTETPGRVLVREADGTIVVEPLPSVEELRGVHAGRYEEGEVLEHLREMDAEDRRLERDERVED